MIADEITKWQAKVRKGCQDRALTESDRIELAKIDAILEVALQLAEMQESMLTRPHTHDPKMRNFSKAERSGQRDADFFKRTTPPFKRRPRAS